MNKINLSNDFLLVKGDAFKVLKNINKNSVDMIFADPPYFLSNGGISCYAGKQISVNKAKWDKTEMTLLEKIKYSRKWVRFCREILKDKGTIWISGTMHNIYIIGVALELEGFSIINNITWQKKNPTPNLACRCFTHSTETILWARKKFNKNKKGKHYFNYMLMKELNGNKQMKDVWLLNSPLKNEKKFGKHPTQKPESLLERIILASTKEGDLILDPFCGSGTTGIVASKLNRKFIGIEKEDEYIDIIKKRFNNLKGEL